MNQLQWQIDRFRMQTGLKPSARDIDIMAKAIRAAEELNDADSDRTETGSSGD